MAVLRRQRPEAHSSPDAVADDAGFARSFEGNDLPPYDDRWERLLDNLEEYLILAAWIFFLLAAGILIFP